MLRKDYNKSPPYLLDGLSTFYAADEKNDKKAAKEARKFYAYKCMTYLKENFICVCAQECEITSIFVSIQYFPGTSRGFPAFYIQKYSFKS